MRVCGVGIKAATACLAIVDFSDGELSYQKLGEKKLELKDDADSANVRSLASSIESFATQHKIDKFVIKQRQKTGAMASGGITFKIEGLFQMQKKADVCFVSAQALTKVSKTNFGAIPDSLARYQNDAFLAAAAFIQKNENG
jgi:hypothetical protein